jgi:hypothetical protein
MPAYLREGMTMNIPTKLSTVLAAILMLGSASAAVAKARYHVYVPDRARGAYGASAHRAFAGTPRYPMPINACRLRWGERPEELIQDRDYQETLGEDC